MACSKCWGLLNRALALAGLFLVVVTIKVSAFGQSTSGTISGSVSDQSGAMVERATITITQTERNFTQAATSDRQGHFVFQQLPPGRYTLDVTVQGFKSYQKQGIVLEAGADMNVGMNSLAVGSANQVVEVLAQGEQIQTSNAQRSETLNNQQMENLAVNGRSYLSLVQLVPGVATVPNVETASHSGLGGISVNGNRNSTNNLTIDGIGNVDTGNNGDQLVTISIDNVQEFTLVTNNFQPEYGRSAGSQIIVVTKSGTSQYHGEGYIFHRNDSLNAHN